MSMNTQFYIGAYLECNTSKAESSNILYYLDEEYEDKVSELQGELRNIKTNITLLGANYKIPGIDRQLTFDRDSKQPVDVNVSEECLLFASEFVKLASMLEQNGVKVKMKWGIVPGVF